MEETIVILTSIVEGMRAPIAVHALTPRGNLGDCIGGRIVVDWLRERFSLPEPEYPPVPRFNRVTHEMPSVDRQTRIELPASWREEFDADWTAAKAAAKDAFDAAFKAAGLRAANAAYEEARDSALRKGARERRNQEDLAVTRSTLWRVKTRPYVRA